MTDEVFSPAYAARYDTLYSTKDYDGECDFLEAVFARSVRPVRRVLDLGCGTGEHAVRLVRRGYRVVGVDRSPAMLELARDKAAAAGVEVAFELGDARSFDLGRRFDAVIAMFAVMGYQTGNDDLAAVAARVAGHLEPGGLFCFDAWHGPGVLSDPPQPRVREVRSGATRVLRTTEPALDSTRQVVATTFRLLQTDGDRVVSEVEECHLMRYLFPQEVAYFLTVAGFSEVRFCPFPRLDEPLDERHWQFAVIAGMPVPTGAP